jgi:hypothetical protein
MTSKTSTSKTKQLKKHSKPTKCHLSIKIAPAKSYQPHAKLKCIEMETTYELPIIEEEKHESEITITADPRK